MVYGVSGEKVGLGRYINDESNLSHTPGVFAGLLMVILLGLAVESLIFKTVEKRTVRRWGMET